MSTAGQGSPGRACPGPESSLPASQPGGCLAWLVEAAQHVSGSTFAEQFPSFINERWQQPCELGLSGRGSARLGRPGPWLPGLSICSVLLLPAGHPERLCTQSEVRAFGGRRQLLTPTPGAGLGRAGQGRGTPVHPPPYHHPHTGSWARRTKAFRGRGLHDKVPLLSEQAVVEKACQALAKVLAASPHPQPRVGWGYPVCWERKTRHGGESTSLSMNSNRLSRLPSRRPGGRVVVTVSWVSCQ